MEEKNEDTNEVEEYREFTLEEKKKFVKTVANKDSNYRDKLSAYEYLCEEGEEVVDDMLKEIQTAEGESGQMLAEILSNYKGRKDIFMWLVTYFYRGEDVALFARLLGSYGDERAISILQSFAQEYEIDYNEFIEIRNAVEELGGEFNLNKDFSDDPLYHYLKGVDEPSVFDRKIAEEEEEERKEEEELFNDEDKE